MLKRIVICMLAAFCLPVLDLAAAPPQLSFQKARSMMTENSNRLQAASENVESRKQTVDSQKTLWGPTVSVQAVELWGETHIDIDRSIKTPLGKMPIRVDEHKNFNGPRASATATFPIFSGGKILAEQKAGKFALQQAEAEKQAVGVDLDAKLIGRYFGLQLALAIERVRKEMLDQQKREAERARQFEREGMISKVERMGVEVARDKSERQWLQARDNARVARIELCRLLQNDDPGQLATPLFVLKNGLEPLSTWVDRAVDGNPQIAVIEAKVKQADQGANSAMGNWLPEIFAFGNYSFIHHYQTMIEPQWLAGVGINLTLWDARGRMGAYKSARATLREAKAMKADAINQARSDAEVAWQHTRNAMERYQLTAGNVALARENLELKTRGFEEGLNISLEMTEARAQLAEAQVDRKIAAYDFVVNFAILHAIAGRMEDFIKCLAKKDLILEK